MKSFIPFGAQYYRAPTPHGSEWEKDLKNIRELGFNTVKYWAQWRWNNPGEGRYYFDDLDQLMDIAAHHGLKVIINTIFDVGPAWFYRKYPESVMITCDGRRVEPQATAWRQIGGAPGPCYNHEEGRKIRNEFLKETVIRYKDHPALFVWDLWNEPELTCGILREPEQKDMVCYCGICLTQFRHWLCEKYNDIGSLNKCWGRNYSCFEEVEAPRNGGTFKDMVDWRTFFSWVLTEELKTRVRITKQFDECHPVMVHTVPPPWFNVVNACSNDYEMADLVDIFGNSSKNDPFPAALSCSAARGKQVFSSEIHALGGDTYGRPAIPSFEEMKSYILVPLARGVKGFLYWQYRAEILGHEAPAWGLADLSGGKTRWLEDAARISGVIQENAELISSVSPVSAEIAVINSYKNSVFDWCASPGGFDTSYNSLLGVFKAIYDNNLIVDILGAEQLCCEMLKQYKVIYYPFPYYVERKTTELLRQWVKEGGCLISEAFFAGMVDDEGLHSMVLPGESFTEVFGAREGLAQTTAAFLNAYDKHWNKDEEDKYVTITLTEELQHSVKGSRVNGYYFREELIPMNAKVLGRFHNGSPAITANNYGKGKAVLIGSLLGYVYAKAASDELKSLFYSLMHLGNLSHPLTVEGGQVRADILLNKKGEAILILNNHSFEKLQIRIKILMNPGSGTKLTNLFTNEEIILMKQGDSFIADLPINAQGHEIFSIL